MDRKSAARQMSLDSGLRRNLSSKGLYSGVTNYWATIQSEDYAFTCKKHIVNIGSSKRGQLLNKQCPVKVSSREKTGLFHNQVLAQVVEPNTMGTLFGISAENWNPAF